MRRLLSTTAAAAAFAGLLGLQAYAQQDPASTTQEQTKIKTEHAKEVTVTGCLLTGTEAKTYILDKVEPVKTTDIVGTSGEVMTVTKYDLVPTEKVEFQPQVGHKVEVTGVVVPAGEGDAKLKVETKLPGAEQQSETKIAKGATPQFRVISIKQLGDTCSGH